MRLIPFHPFSKLGWEDLVLTEPNFQFIVRLFKFPIIEIEYSREGCYFLLIFLAVGFQLGDI